MSSKVHQDLQLHCYEELGGLYDQGPCDSSLGMDLYEIWDEAYPIPIGYVMSSDRSRTSQYRRKLLE